MSFVDILNSNKRVVNALKYLLYSIDCNCENLVQTGDDTKRLVDAEAKQRTLLLKHNLFIRLN